VTNLTITLKEDVLEKAQRKASLQGTSVAEILRSYLEAYVDDQPKEHQQGIALLLDLSYRVRSGSGGEKGARDDLHAR
jgi:uncharacterized protein DUF6364